MCTPEPAPAQVVEPDSNPPGYQYGFLLFWGGQFGPKDMSTHGWLFLAMLFLSSKGSKITLSFS